VSRPTTCYLCGGNADGADDHVPPEVFFKGFGGNRYKSPRIVTVPSCRAHNETCSVDDETLAWVVCDAAIPAGSQAAFDVYQNLFAPIPRRMYSDREFVDQRLGRIGVRVLRDPHDYDQDGNPARQQVNDEYMRRTAVSLRERWIVLERGFQKIAAGIFFHASAGTSLGARDTERLQVVVPQFKYFGESSILNEAPINESEFFSSKMQWRSIESGSPDVFLCEISHHRRTKQFEMKLHFYRSIDVWVKTDGLNR
jgi:hypothetical protein